MFPFFVILYFLVHCCIPISGIILNIHFKHTNTDNIMQLYRVCNQLHGIKIARKYICTLNHLFQTFSYCYKIDHDDIEKDILAFDLQFTWQHYPEAVSNAEESFL